MPEQACRLAIHGGAGVIDRAALTPAREAEFRGALQWIAAAAWARLVAGASALDVVELAVRDLEDFPLFNAGHGAVLNSDGVAELDASIMDGRTRRAGAIAAARTTRHPVSVARAVMERSEHVLLAGGGADRFAALHGLELAPPAHFITAARAAPQRLAAERGRVTLDHDAIFNPADTAGTVGAVARDAQGHLAAATSTGGMTNKHVGRVGDSPIVGAGTWAEDASCAVSATGHGEYFLLSALAHEVHARIALTGADLKSAGAAALARVAELGGSGGLIAIDHRGEIATPYNSEGMYRATVGADGVLRVAIYAD
ncbi:MAG: isoaspartyl peptidase/L-asparaginase [Xanthomonadales bacterium]|nr:isoaspartyl peptidase/L-asparaginase [Xanthomonadales bacterium]